MSEVAGAPRRTALLPVRIEPQRTALLPVRIDQLLGRGEPDRPALTYKSQTLTYRELSERVARFAAGLHRLGIRRGDRVAVYAEKRIETVVALLATSAAGAVFVPVNPLFKVRHLTRLLADCAARAVVTTAERAEVVRESLAANTAVEHVLIIGDPGKSRLPGGPWQVSGRSNLSYDRMVQLDVDYVNNLRQHRRTEGRGAHAPQSAGRRRQRGRLSRSHQR